MKQALNVNIQYFPANFGCKRAVNQYPVLHWTDVKDCFKNVQKCFKIYAVIHLQRRSPYWIDFTTRMFFLISLRSWAHKFTHILMTHPRFSLEACKNADFDLSKCSNFSLMRHITGFDYCKAVSDDYKFVVQKGTFCCSRDIHYIHFWTIYSGVTKWNPSRLWLAFSATSLFKPYLFFWFSHIVSTGFAN